MKRADSNVCTAKTKHNYDTLKIWMAFDAYAKGF